MEFDYRDFIDQVIFLLEVLKMSYYEIIKPAKNCVNSETELKKLLLTPLYKFNYYNSVKNNFRRLVINVNSDKSGLIIDPRFKQFYKNYQFNYILFNDTGKCLTFVASPDNEFVKRIRKEISSVLLYEDAYDKLAKDLYDYKTKELDIFFD